MWLSVRVSRLGNHVTSAPILKCQAIYNRVQSPILAMSGWSILLTRYILTTVEHLKSDTTKMRI